ncbi:MAG: hypothetical protein MZV63_20455 [Marinilabiliales bacterium]|nr:hypothetical protein [Marinilabiliales bacterium]
MDRQVLSAYLEGRSLQPEFHWTKSMITQPLPAFFQFVYAICLLFAGRFIDWIDTKKGFLWAMVIWSAGAVLHAFAA